ncbi:MAG: Mpo1-like protein [Candidatus Acidiferrales bacterium]
MTEGPQNFSEFWPHYVLAHSEAWTRIFHFTGTLAGWTLLALAIFLRRPWLLPAALLTPYAFAWISHFFIEHNRPASFDHPLWSWIGDQKMFMMVLAGRMGKELKRCREADS